MQQVTVYVKEWTEDDFNDQSDHPELLNVEATAAELNRAIENELSNRKFSVSVAEDNDRVGEVEGGNKEIQKRLANILRDDGIFHLDRWQGVYDEASE